MFHFFLPFFPPNYAVSTDNNSFRQTKHGFWWSLIEILNKEKTLNININWHHEFSNIYILRILCLNLMTRKMMNILTMSKNLVYSESEQVLFVFFWHGDVKESFLEEVINFPLKDIKCWPQKLCNNTTKTICWQSCLLLGEVRDLSDISEGRGQSCNIYWDLKVWFR